MYDTLFVTIGNERFHVVNDWWHGTVHYLKKIGKTEKGQKNFSAIFQKVFVFCPFLGVHALYYNENKFIGLKLEIKEQNNNLLITIGKQVDFLFL